MYWPSTTVLDNSNTTAAEASVPIVTSGNGRRRRLRPVVVSHSRNGRLWRLFSGWSTKTQVLRLRAATNETLDDVLSSRCRPLRDTILSLVAKSRSQQRPSQRDMSRIRTSTKRVQSFVGSFFDITYPLHISATKKVKSNVYPPRIYCACVGLAAASVFVRGNSCSWIRDRGIYAVREIYEDR